VTSAARVPILIVGLGEPGLAVLRDVLASGSFIASVFDPLPVRAIDLPPVGLDRPHPESIEMILAPVIKEMRVVVCDGSQPLETLLAVADACRRASVPLVPLEIHEDRASIGPVLNGCGPEPLHGCFLCARQHRAQRDPFEAALVQEVEMQPARPVPWCSRHDAHTLSSVSQFVLLAIDDALRGNVPRRALGNRQIRINPERHTASLEKISPHHRCRRCYPIIDQNLLELRHETERRWKQAFHANPEPPPALAGLWQRLQALVGEENGIFRTPVSPTWRHRQRLWGSCRTRGAHPETNALANAHLVVASRPSVIDTRAVSVLTEGLDFDDQAAAGALALIEGLERLVVLDGGDPHRMVRRRYADISADALDPRRFPLFAPEQYEDPEFALRPFDPSTLMSWVWGMRLGAERPVLVPADLVHATASPIRIYKANSNGAACHSRFHDAVLNGIYETIERDALMITWLNRLSMPLVDLGPNDPDPFSVREAWGALSLHCDLVDITTDLNVPVLLGVLRDLHNPDFLLVDPVASLDPTAILGKLQRELAQFSLPYLLDPLCYRTAATRDLDGNSVVDFPDHVGFYQAREKHPAAAFLTGAPKRRALADGPHWRPGLTVRETIEEIVARLGCLGHEVIVVDCTVPLLDSLGLCAVKVLIPGLQPLNAGHRYRVLGGRRVLEAPPRMGMSDRERARNELNPSPHPFW